jgi:hypothetical protein
MVPDGTPEGIRRSVGNCVKILDGKKNIDIFEMARVDRNTPLETTVRLPTITEQIDIYVEYFQDQTVLTAVDESFGGRNKSRQH